MDDQFSNFRVQFLILVITFLVFFSLILHFGQSSIANNGNNWYEGDTGCIIFTFKSETNLHAK